MTAPFAVLAGDCRDRATVRRLMDGEKAQVVITSPPYADRREYDKSSGFEPIKPDKYVDWFRAVSENIADILAPDGSFFINIKAHCEDGDRLLYVADLVIAHVRSWGWHFRDEFIWKHTGFPGEYKYRHRNQFEPIYHFTRQHHIKHRPLAVGIESDMIRDNMGGRGRGGGHMVATNQEHDRDAGKSLPFKTGVAQVGNVIECAVNSESTGHVAAMPVPLAKFFIQAFSDPGDLIYDPFGGSGTTCVAALLTGRRGRMTELSPAYCDVAVERLLKQDAKLQAILAGHGCTFEHARFGRRLEAQDALKEEILSHAG